MNPATPTFGASGGGGWGAADLGQLFAGIGQTVASTYQAFNQPKGTTTVFPAGQQATGAPGSGVSSQTVLLVVGGVLIVGGIAWALMK